MLFLKAFTHTMENPGGQSHDGQPGNKHAEPDSLSHQALRNVHALSKMGVLAMDADGRITYVNPAALAYFGVQEGDILSKPFTDILEDSSTSKTNIAKIKALEEITDQEFKVATRVCEYWLLISSLVHRDSEGMVETYLFARDISKLKKKENLVSYLNQAAADLAKTRDTPGALQQIAQLIVPRFANWFTIDQIKDNRLELLVLKHADPEKIQWAYEYRRKYPTDLNSNVGAAIVVKSGQPGFAPFITPEMIDVTVPDPVQRDEVNKIGLHSVIMVPITSREKVSGLVNFISSDPNHHFDEVDLEFARNFAALISLALENTRLNEEAAHELKLREQSEERLRFLTDAIPHKVWTSAPDGRATYYNRQWHDFTGVEGFAELRDRIWDLIHPDDRKVAEVEWPKAIRIGEPMEMEHRFKRHDGVYRWHLSRFIPFKNDKAEIELWVGTSTDIHEQKSFEFEIASANEELRSANEELGSANEELASANEELATTNEELTDAQRMLQEMVRNVEQSELILKNVVESAPFPIGVYTGREMRIAMANKSIMDVWGKGYDVIGKTYFEILPELAEQDIYPQLDAVFMTGDAYHARNQRVDIVVDNALRPFYFNYSFTPLHDAKGKIYGVMNTAAEVTDLVLAKQQVEQSEAKFKDLVQYAPVGIAIYRSRDMIVDTVNEGMLKIWGKPASVAGKPLAVALPELISEGQPFLQLILDVFDTGDTYQGFEARALLRHGDELREGFFDFIFQPLKDEGDRVVSVLQVAIDVTQRVVARKQLQQTEETLLLAVEAARIGILQFEPKSKHLHFNEMAAELLGYDAQKELTFDDLYGRIPAEHKQHVLHTIRDAARSRQEYDIAFPLHRFDDDKLVWLRSIGKINADEKSGQAVFSGVVIDVTEQKRDEIRKNDFIGMVSHELKTPLTSLAAIVQLLNIKLKGSTDPFMMTAGIKAEKQVKRMAAMINGFLNISRLESGKIHLIKTRFELSELLAEVIQETELTTSTHQVGFNQDGQVWVDADRDKISSVISNLLSNSIKYSPRGTEIDVNYMEAPGEVIVSVTDRGIGIKQEDTAKLFERYSRVETDMTMHISGFGIGLYLCREILELHDGRIWVESEFGRGSTFYFSLPLPE
jgi:PAS domain S-box-containing protein